MKLFYLFSWKSFLLPLSNPCLTRASLLFFFCFIREACGVPIAAGLLSRLR
jgi:hypothetical protein